MKNNKLMKLFLSFLIVLTITSTNANIISGINFSYDSQVELLSEDGEESPVGEFRKR